MSYFDTRSGVLMMVDGVRTDGEVDATEDRVDEEGKGGEKTSMLRLDR